jgi:hypothetical protein
MTAASTETIGSFTDVRVGQVAQVKSAEHAAGLAGFAGWLEDLKPCSDALVSDLRWVPVERPEPAVQASSTITRWRVDPDRATGTIHCDIALRAENGSISERAQVRWRVADVTATADDPTRIARDFGSLPWARALAHRLGNDPSFASSTGSFDGSIALTVGDDDIDLRIYKGNIVEVAKKSLLGATFAIAASELTWVELFTGPYDDFVRLAARSAFRVRGSGFEYLRLTKAVRILVSHAREMAAGDHNA